MRIPMIVTLAVSLATFSVPASVSAQDEQIGQQGSVWNLGELAQRTYPSTVTAMNQSCPGAHDFHISLQGEAAEFLIIVGPTVLTGITPGDSKTSDVLFDLRSTTPGPHNEGTIAVRCVDCPFTCSQDYDLLAVHLTVIGDANAVPPESVDGGNSSPWSGIDLTSLDPTIPMMQNGTTEIPGLRWINPDALDRMTLATDAVGDDLVTLEFVGTGHPAGDIFVLTITRSAPTPFEMGFPLGTLIVPDDPAFSPMMVADDGAVALLDEVTIVTVPGYTLDPTLNQPLTPDQINGAGAPSWTVLPPPTSGFNADAMNFINAGYALAGNLGTVVPLDNYLGTVVQRAIWSEAHPDAFDQGRLGQDIVAQVDANDGAQSEDDIEQATEVIWADILQVANMGKSR